VSPILSDLELQIILSFDFTMRLSVERARDNDSVNEYQQQPVSAEKAEKELEVAVGVASSGSSAKSEGGRSQLVPVKMKLLSILMVTAIGFGSHWSSGVTGAMKSTLKKVNQYGTT
jgi:hypothetical protein